MIKSFKNRMKKYLSSPTQLDDSIHSVANGLNVELLEPRMMLSTVQIFAAGQTGAEELTLLINDQEVQTFDHLGSGAQQGDFQRLVFNTDENVSAGDIRIEFNNDAFDAATGADNNLTVDRIVIDGQTFFTESTPMDFSILEVLVRTNP